MGTMPKEPDAFVEHVVKLIKRMQPEFNINRVNPNELHVNGRRLDLENLYRMVAHEPDRGTDIVEHFLDQLFMGDHVEVNDIPLEQAKARIMPRIQPISIFEHLTESLVAHVPYVNDTVIVFVAEQDGYDAARLLMSDLHAKLAKELGPDFYVATPARDMFIALSCEPESFVQRLCARVSEDFTKLPYPITKELFLVTQDGVAGTTWMREDAA